MSLSLLLQYKRTVIQTVNIGQHLVSGHFIEGQPPLDNYLPFGNMSHFGDMLPFLSGQRV